MPELDDSNVPFTGGKQNEKENAYSRKIRHPFALELLAYSIICRMNLSANM
jgi:hypothetical protein